MKLTKSKLKQLIKEELKKAINQSSRTEKRYRENFEGGLSPRETAEQMFEDFDDIELAQKIANNLPKEDVRLAKYIRRVADAMEDIRNDPKGMFDEPDRYGGERYRSYGGSVYGPGGGYGRYEEGKLAKSSKKRKTK